jgi:MFS transporter, SP family, sugar:H+ symporter
VVGNVLAMPAFIAQFSRQPGHTALTANEISIISSIPVSGGFIGALIVSYVGDKYGRKKCIYLGCLINVVSAALQTAATDIALLTVGRFLASKSSHTASVKPELISSGLSAFILLATSVAFQNEVAPPAIRGLLGSLGIVAVNLGGVISSGASFGTWRLASTAAFRVPLGIQMLFPLVISLGIFFTTDSPTSFLIKGNDSEAEKSLRRIRQGYSEHEIAEEIASLKLQQSLREAEKEVPWTELFRGTNLRRTLLAAYIGNIQVLAGLFYSTNYATIFLAQTGSSDPFLLVFGLSILALGGAVAGLVIVDRIGRRTLALWSIAIIFVIDLIIGVMGCLDLTNLQIAKTLAAFFLLFGFFFAAGFGPLVGFPWRLDDLPC